MHAVFFKIITKITTTQHSSYRHQFLCVGQLFCEFAMEYIDFCSCNVTKREIVSTVKNKADHQRVKENLRLAEVLVLKNYANMQENILPMLDV